MSINFTHFDIHLLERKYNHDKIQNICNQNFEVSETAKSFLNSMETVFESENIFESLIFEVAI